MLTVPATAAKTKPSVASMRSNLPRRAPSTARIAISLRRAPERDSRSIVTSLRNVRKMSSRVTPGADKQITRQLPVIDNVTLRSSYSRQEPAGSGIPSKEVPVS